MTIHKLKYASIADIGVFNLTFYDKSKEQELVKFCKDNGISYLPARDRKTVYQLFENGFQICVLDDSFKINPYERVFDVGTIEKFSCSDHNEVRFIMENECIKGVVHIIDYNSEFLQVELYRAFFQFETRLRNLLVKHGKQNKDFVQWVRGKYEQEKDENSKRYWENMLKKIDPVDEVKKEKVEYKMKETNPFQTFYLLDLLRFACNEGVISKKHVNIDHVARIRNLVAHSISLTSRTEMEEGSLVYNFDQLKEYLQLIRSFFIAYDHLNEKVDEYVSKGV